jgi:hypothetical protein
VRMLSPNTPRTVVGVTSCRQHQQIACRGGRKRTAVAALLGGGRSRSARGLFESWWESSRGRDGRSRSPLWEPSKPPTSAEYGSTFIACSVEEGTQPCGRPSSRTLSEFRDRNRSSQRPESESEIGKERRLFEVRQHYTASLFLFFPPKKMASIPSLGWKLELNAT